MLFELVQALPMPADPDRRREFKVPETSAVSMASMLESVHIGLPAAGDPGLVGCRPDAGRGASP